MTPQIKQRIEQLRRGEVPEGYKRTKAGVVPEEWEEKRIGDVLTQRKTLLCVSEDAPLLSFTIEEGVIDPADKKSNKREFLIKDITTKKFALTEVGDIIYNPANLKFGAIHRNNLRRGVVSPIYGVFYGAQNSIFMGSLLHNQRFIDYAKTYTEGTVEKLKTLNADTFLKLKITLPPLAEQKKIAEILSAQDKLIALKEKLIEEKKRQKKYLMQQLLTGKKRLPGFNGEWKEEKIGDFCGFIGGGTPDTKNEKYWQGDTPWISSSDLEMDDLFTVKINRYITEDAITNSATKKCPSGSILVVTRVGVGKVALASTELCTSQDFTSIFQSKHNNLYITYAIYWLMQEKLSKVQGSSIKGIPSKEFQNYKITIPSLSEQTAIVNILSTMDNELNLLGCDLDQEKQKKKALMQLLLSGVVRVNV